MNKKQIDRILWDVEVDSYNRFDKFLEHSAKFKGNLYWYALESAYTSSDNLYKNYWKARKAFGKREVGRNSMMTKKESLYLKNLPNRIKIYRGMTEEELKGGIFGVSWTLDRKIAEFFINKYRRNHDTESWKKVIHELTINKKSVIAYWIGRNESEIIYIRRMNRQASLKYHIETFNRQ